MSHTDSDSSEPRTLRLGILAAVEPHAWTSAAVAEVVTAQIEERRNDITVEFRTVVTDDAPRTRTPWQPATTASWPTDVDAILVDASLDTAARAAAGVGADADCPVIETHLFDDVAALCSLFAGTLDPTAVDTRRRMLTHLGALPRTSSGKAPDADASDLLQQAEDAVGGRLTATDRFIVAEAIGTALLAGPDPLSAALAGGRTDQSTPATAEFDRVVTALADVEPTSTAHTAWLQRRVAVLEADNARLTDLIAATTRQATDRLDAAAARERSLSDRLEALTLRSELTADPAT